MAHDESAARLRAARERAGLTQREAAIQLGIHYGSMNRYEQGKMRVPADLLMRAEALPGKAIDETDESPSPHGGPGVPMIAISRDAAMFWRGRLVEQVHTLRGASESMQALLRMLEHATDGVEGVVKSGVLPSVADAQDYAIDPVVRAAQAVANLPKEPRPNADAGAGSGREAATGASTPATQPARRRGRRVG